MKKFVIVLSVLFFGNLQAFASDQLHDEVVCNKIQRPGESDTGVTLILRGNQNAWAKFIAIYENGYAGPRQIGNVQVPVNPEISGGGRGYIPEVNLVYRGQGIVLALRALQIQNFPLTGAAIAMIALPGRQPMQIKLICTRMN
ncbi:MAG: hypothetical protein KF802_09140 [Bdellovibrionaceae bacterium]|nr:hypothetical protein [Pseudobdellovibrionaceae bacterium]